MNKEAKIRNIVLILLIGFVTSVFFHYFKGVYLNMPYPHNTFLFSPVDKFNDFFNAYNNILYRQPYSGDHQIVYYPFLNFIYIFFSKLPVNVSFVVSILLFLFVFIKFTILYTYPKNTKNHLLEIFVISFLTYPILFTLDRGNAESLVFISLLAFIFFYEKKNYLLSTIFLSFAIAMKLFPIVLLLVYLSDKKYKEIFLTGLFTVLLTILSLSFFKGGFFENLMQLVNGTNINLVNTFLGGNTIVQRGSSLFTLMKIIFIETDLIYKMDMGIFLDIYVKTAVIIFLFITAYVVFVEKEFWKKIALLTLAMLLFPHVSADYKLIHLFIPIFLFINAPKSNYLDRVYLVLFSLLLIPKDYFLLSKVLTDAGVADISISVIFNPIIMILILLLIIGTGLRSWISHKKNYPKMGVS